jgi:hypothetical protein
MVRDGEKYGNVYAGRNIPVKTSARVNVLQY